MSVLPAFLHYPGATAKGVATMTGAEEGTWYNFETEDSTASVLDFYKKALAGWNNSPTRERRAVPTNVRAAVAVLAYDSRDGKQSVTIRVATDRHSNKTFFSLLYSKRH